MIKRALVSGLVATVVAIGVGGLSRAEEPAKPPVPSVILDLVNRPIESQEQAFNKALKAEALAPAPAPIDQWEAQPDGSMRHKKTGLTVVVRNPCPPGDIEHEFALAAYNRAMAKKPRH